LQNTPFLFAGAIQASPADGCQGDFEDSDLSKGEDHVEVIGDSRWVNAYCSKIKITDVDPHNN
jgi:hypothetical protein